MTVENHPSVRDGHIRRVDGPAGTRLSYVRRDPAPRTIEGTLHLTPEGAELLRQVGEQVEADDLNWAEERPTFWHNGPGHFLLWALWRWPLAAEFVHNHTRPTKPVRRRGGSGSGG